MLVRLLHGALALSLASEPAASEAEPSAPKPEADGDAPAEPDTDSEPAADEPTEPEPTEPEPTEPEPTEPEPTEPEPTEPEPTEPESPEPAVEEEPAPPPPPAAATEAPRPLTGLPPSGRNDDIVDKALLGGGIASLTLTAGLIGTSAWAWTEHNRAKRAIPNLTGDAELDARDRRDGMRTLGLITTGTAALYGTTGIVLLLLRARDRNPRRTVLAPSPGGVSLTGRF